MANPVRDYAWGSTTDLAAFLGRPPTGGPEAELWIGAHEGDPSCLPDGRRLNDVIGETPRPMLGRRVCDIFGDRLPFLMKVLAVGQPLSLQVHPSGERARRGHRRENDAGVPVDDGRRNYKDPWHKPELVVALTTFEGLAGFRDVGRTAAILRLLDVAWAHETADRLGSGPVFQALRGVVTDTLALDGPELAGLLAEVGSAARCAAVEPDAEAARALALVDTLLHHYPHDPGVLVALLLNHVVLAPGEAMFVDAGVVHAYLGGVGVEIMASSDNVLRAGLTPKHVDVDELLRITSFTPVPPPRWDPSESSDDYCYMEPPVSEFSLTIGRAPLRRLPASGPRVLLVLDGTVTVTRSADPGAALTATRGQSVFITHDDGAVDLSGEGRVAVGAVPA